MSTGDVAEDQQTYVAASQMDVFVRVWAGGGQLMSVMANNTLVPIDPIFGTGELRLGAGAALKSTTVDLDAAFEKTNPLATSAYLNFELFQRRAGSPTKFKIQTFGPYEVPFDAGTQAQRQTSVSIL